MGGLKKMMNRDMSKLLLVISSSSAAKCLLLAQPDGDDYFYDETEGVIRDVGDATAAVSAALFNGLRCSQSQSSSADAVKWKPWMKKTITTSDLAGIEELKEASITTPDRMEELEKVIESIETCSERVFRGLINTRVSLLNVLTL